MSSTAPSTDAPGPDVSAADGAARDRAGLFEQIARVSPDIVYVYDLAADRTVYRNRDPSALIGYGPEEIDAMGPAPWRRIVHGEDVQVVEAARARLAEAADGEVVEYEIRVRRPDGVWRWLAAR
ncbi:MAG TPA: PAS domain-containing protein, partial [Azospirillaceae bacterium]|nr:PAS domain-containing protein [Azospirillaceae bacterium]